jgi:hypothetical protein
VLTPGLGGGTPHAGPGELAPTIERARAEGLSVRGRIFWRVGSVDLLAREPDAQHALAAVILVARVQRRESWDRRVEMSIRLAETAKMEMPPPPDGYVDASHTVLAARDGAPHRCGMCGLLRGKSPCPRCSGSGVVTLGSHDSAPTQLVCEPCKGSGFIVCTTCEGTGEAVGARIHYVEDRAAALRYTYVPSIPSALESELTALLEPVTDPPAHLRFDAQPRVAGSAYRGTQKVEATTFHGFRFEDAAARARVAAANVGGKGTVVREDVRTYAWPFLWLEHKVFGGRRHVLLVVGPDGRMRGTVTD